MSKTQTTANLRRMLESMFALQYEGASMQAHARAQGLVDGYMRALVDLEVATEKELVEIVNEERRLAAARGRAITPTTSRTRRAAAFA